MKKIIFSLILAVAFYCGCSNSIDGFEEVPAQVENTNWIPDSISIEDPDLDWVNLQDCRVAPTELLVPIQDSDYFELLYLGGDSIEVVYSTFDLGTGHFRVDYAILTEMLTIYLQALGNDAIEPDDTVVYKLSAIWASHIIATESNPYYQEPIYGDLIYGNWTVGDTLIEVIRPSTLQGIWEIDDIFYTTLINDFLSYTNGDSVEVYVWEDYFRDHVIY